MTAEEYVVQELMNTKAERVALKERNGSLRDKIHALENLLAATEPKVGGYIDSWGKPQIYLSLTSPDEGSDLFDYLVYNLDLEEQICEMHSKLDKELAEKAKADA